MKKLSIVVVALSLCIAVSAAIAGEVVKGTVKSVDAKAGSIVISMDDKDVALKAGKDVDLGKLKAGDKVEAMVEKETVESIKTTAQAKPKVMTGC